MRHKTKYVSLADLNCWVFFGKFIICVMAMTVPQSHLFNCNSFKAHSRKLKLRTICYISSQNQTKQNKMKWKGCVYALLPFFFSFVCLFSTQLLLFTMYVRVLVVCNALDANLCTYTNGFSTVIGLIYVCRLMSGSASVSAGALAHSHKQRTKCTTPHYWYFFNQIESHELHYACYICWMQITL